MPFISVDHAAGLSATDRKRLQARLAQVVLDTFAATPASVRVYTRAFDSDDLYQADGNTEACLPVIRAEFLPGRSMEQRRALVKGLAHTAAEVLGVPIDQVRIILSEKDRADWVRGDKLVADQ